ncbi:type I restriction enzyme HsdR N-terminal domain-containing protein [Desulfoluna spongiiphila]|uniref:Type I restriction enzyme R protein N terminus (HSDR_N) n=1 Tax=Desulfoluna spongiiphila TaxID=419481 RepID=A0A1G5GNT1_9BACT|nr:type I restriction enzyme HsdR N-terminal domain-containing protein [Desulfoluna spongiiphila]SCY53225.1 Type I restriction enzyme R protein N terminus (HSDR_N) [Desulfoluna spongiiphila]
MTEGHHLVLGTLTDCLTGKTLTDTHDERYRQGIARHLLGVCGFAAEEIEASRVIEVGAGEKKARFPVDFIVSLGGIAAMVVRYRPGSIVTRHRSGQALCLVLAPHEIPVVVVTNGEEADVLHGGTGELRGQGFDAIPSRGELEAVVSEANMAPVSDRRRELAHRILFACEVDDSCPCDTSISRLD